MRGRIHEQSFNTALGEALKKISAYQGNRGDCIYPEKTGLLAGKHARKRIDILINDEVSKPVAIEAAFDESDANKDAQTRDHRLRIR